MTSHGPVSNSVSQLLNRKKAIGRHIEHLAMPDSMVQRGKDVKPEDRQFLRERRAMRKRNNGVDLPNFDEIHIPTLQDTICTGAITPETKGITPKTRVEVRALLRRPSAFDTRTDAPPFPQCKIPASAPTPPDWTAARARLQTTTLRPPERGTDPLLQQKALVRCSSGGTSIRRECSSGEVEPTVLRASSWGRLVDKSG